MYSVKRKQAALCIILCLLRRRQRKRQGVIKSRIWVKEWIKKRNQCGVVNNLLCELRNGDEKFYKNFLRVSSVDFDYLLEKVTPLITKKDTFMRKAITPTEKLIVTLRYLATGKCLDYFHKYSMRHKNA